jgi:hypothetical protein
MPNSSGPEEAQSDLDIDGFSERKLSRYMSFFRFAYLLQHGLYIPRVASFSDRWEGLLGVRKRIRSPEEWGKSFSLDQHKEALRWVHVSCWYEGVQESFLMWKAYGASEEAVMIESSVARLEMCYRASDELHVGYLGKVRYFPLNGEPSSYQLPSLIAPFGSPHPASVSGWPDYPDLVPLLPELFAKYEHFSGESERRLVCLNKDHAQEGVTPRPGLVLRLSSPADLIKRVRVSPFAPDIVLETVSLLLEKLAPGIPVERSQIDAGG